MLPTWGSRRKYDRLDLSASRVQSPQRRWPSSSCDGQEAGLALCQVHQPTAWCTVWDPNMSGIMSAGSSECCIFSTSPLHLQENPGGSEGISEFSAKTFTEICFRLKDTDWMSAWLVVGLPRASPFSSLELLSLGVWTRKLVAWVWWDAYPVSQRRRKREGLSSWVPTRAIHFADTRVFNIQGLCEEADLCVCPALIPLILLIAPWFSFLFKYYFWLWLVFVAAGRLSLAAVSRGYSLKGFSLGWFLLLRSTTSKHVGLSRCGARG